MIDLYLDNLDLAYFELSEAFRELADDNVWKRPAPNHLSIGEIAGHIAYGAATRFSGEVDESGRPILEKTQVKSTFLEKRYSYHPHSLATPPSPEHTGMTAEQIFAEVVRVHKECVAHLKAQHAELDAPTPGWFAQSTLREMLKYQIFHVSYHTGQIYSARLLLGDDPPDN